jgi:hypothetical protein
MLILSNANNDIATEKMSPGPAKEQSQHFACAADSNDPALQRDF